MYSVIHTMMIRQNKAFALLAYLLEEEFELLMERNTAEIMSLELSIHELLRQIMAEKRDLKQSLGGGMLRDYAAMLPEEECNELLRLYAKIDRKEQLCARRSSQNADLSVALLDQSRRVMEFLHNSVQRPQEPAYLPSGSIRKPMHPEASIYSGRF